MVTARCLRDGLSHTHTVSTRKKSCRGALGIDFQKTQKEILASALPAVKPSVHRLRVVCPEEAEASKQTSKEKKLLYIPKQTINRGPDCSQKEEMNNSRFSSFCDLCLVIWARWKKMKILKAASLDENMSETYFLWFHWRWITIQNRYFCGSFLALLENNLESKYVVISKGEDTSKRYL